MGRMTVSLRPANDGDIGALVTLLAQLGYARTPEEVRHGLAAEEGTETIVAEDGKVVGFVSFHTRHHLHQGAKVTSIDALAVDGRFRSAGIGAALVAEVVEAARAHGAVMVDLHSNVARTEARAFYERLGFTVTSNFFVKRLDG
jgi:ribosomal protein S18 acetylase RimI-like enzyme